MLWWNSNGSNQIDDNTNAISYDDKKNGMNKIDDNTNSICYDETIMAWIQMMITTFPYALMTK